MAGVYKFTLKDRFDDHFESCLDYLVSDRRYSQ